MPSLVPLADIADYHTAAETSLRLYFSRVNPNYEGLFIAYSRSEVQKELNNRIEETDFRSSLITLARMEAVLRRDYQYRCREKRADEVSIAFRKWHKTWGDHVRLDDILDIWSRHHDHPMKRVIGEVSRMFKFRHWLAHGRYWNPNKKHDFWDVYSTVEVLTENLGLV
jgi:hypothetical protein